LYLRFVGCHPEGCLTAAAERGIHCQSPNELAHSQGGRPSWLLQAQSKMWVLLVQKGGSGRPALAWLWLIMPPSASSDTMRCDATRRAAWRAGGGWSPAGAVLGDSSEACDGGSKENRVVGASQRGNEQCLPGGRRRQRRHGPRPEQRNAASAGCVWRAVAAVL
jgi:hypothetical protein